MGLSRLRKIPTRLQDDAYAAFCQSYHTQTAPNRRQCPLKNREAYEKAFWAYDIYGWLLEWMGRGMVESADDINAMLLNQ